MTQAEDQRIGITLTRGREVPGHRLWRLRRRHHHIDAVIGDDRVEGVELRFLYNDKMVFARRWPTREQALSDATARRQALERAGWVDHW